VFGQWRRQGGRGKCVTTLAVFGLAHTAGGTGLSTRDSQNASAEQLCDEEY
jgi:molybdopterin biosynthesis enzyme MoaB